MRRPWLAVTLTLSSWALSRCDGVEPAAVLANATGELPLDAAANATGELPPDIADVASVDASTAATEEVADTMTDTVAEAGRPGVGSGEGAGESGSDGSGASGGGSTSGESSSRKTRKKLGTATAPLLLTGLGAAACCGVLPGSRRLRNAKRRYDAERGYYSMEYHNGAPRRHEPV